MIYPGKNNAFRKDIKTPEILEFCNNLMTFRELDCVF